MKKKTNKEITDYDTFDTTPLIDRTKALRLTDLGITLPKEPPTKVLSIRIPTSLLNSIKAYAGDRDIPYATMIKMLLAESLERKVPASSRR
jgi:predicted DNA binding CopG/RHH family protein